MIWNPQNEFPGVPWIGPFPLKGNPPAFPWRGFWWSGNDMEKTSSAVAPEAHGYGIGDVEFLLHPGLLHLS